MPEPRSVPENWRNRRREKAAFKPVAKKFVMPQPSAKTRENSTILARPIRSVGEKIHRRNIWAPNSLTPRTQCPKGRRRQAILVEQIT